MEQGSGIAALRTIPRGALVALMLMTPPVATRGQTPDEEMKTLRADIETLRAENFRLKIQIRELQEQAEASRRSSLSLNSRTGEGRGSVSTGSFFSLTDMWDELEGYDDDADTDADAASGLVPIEKIDTILFHPVNGAVQKYIDIYTVLRKDNMRSILKRYDRYAPMLRSVFRKYGVPEEFSMLAIVESAMNANAVSKAGAAGMWQFMPASASDYGLDLSPMNDERFVPERATDAAARYLRDNRRKFGSWALAIMSYNCGPGTVRKAVNACGGRVTYEQLYKSLPAETRDYVPALVAVMYVNRNRALLLD